MKRTMNRLFCVVLTFVMVVGLLPVSTLAATDPAAIQDTYEIDGVTYFNVGSGNFGVDKVKFFKDLLGTRSDLIRQETYFNEDWSAGNYGWQYASLSEADLWLQLGVMLATDLRPDGIAGKDIEMMYKAAQQGSDRYEFSSGNVYNAARHDVSSHDSMKDAENWVFKQAFGGEKSFGIFKNDTAQQPVIAAAVSNSLNSGSQKVAVAAYFTNFRVFALMPADEGTNYVTELISDSVNSKSTVASTVKNLTASTVTGSQSISNSTTATVSSSVNGSSSYSFTEGLKVGAEYKFTDAFKMSGELSFSATQAFASGWGSGDSLSTSKSASYTVSIPMSPYTQAMLTQTDTTSVYLTSYNCPIALKYDVKIVMYASSNSGYNGVLKVNYSYPAVNRDAVYTFADPVGGARGDLDKRIKNCSEWSDMDADFLRWRYILENGPENYSLHAAAQAMETVRSHVPMAPTGASYTQTLNVIANEVSGLMPTHPLYRVKIGAPSVDIHSDEVSYQLFDYFTANMEVGDYSYANYMNIVGFNKYDVPFYGFSKDNGYWIITDKDGNELDSASAPVLLEKDPVSTNWRYTAVRPGTCYMVYRIDEDAYFIADKPDQPIKNEDLKKTAALEIIVTEKDPTDTIVITGNYYGHANVEPQPLEGENRLTVAVYDETGKEIEKPYTWEAKELSTRGITVTEDGQISFTKEGTFHVRAVNGKLRSDWYEVSAGHTAGEAVCENVVPATCTTDGSQDLVVYCEICGEEISREHETLPAVGHNWGEWTVTKEATVDEEGEETCICLNDPSHIDTRVIPKLEKPTVFNVTLDVDGCGNVYTDKTFASAGETVAVSVAPDEGFVLNYFSVMADNKPVTMRENTFTMPESDVTVIAVFEKKAAATTEPKRFTDVMNPNAWYYDAVYWAVGRGITSGYGEGTFQPTASLTRAQAVTFLYNMAGKPDAADAESAFSDVSDTAWYADAVKWAVANKITSGYGSGTFSPNVNCTRAMIVTFIRNYAENIEHMDVTPKGESTFSDVKDGDWFKSAVDWAVENKITSGYGTGTFSPALVCNRAMMVTFLSNFEKMITA